VSIPRIILDSDHGSDPAGPPETGFRPIDCDSGRPCISPSHEEA